MQRHRYKLLIAALVLAAPAGAQSLGPSEMNAAGRSATVGGNNYEYAIGTVVGQAAYSSASLVVTPGVLQPQNPTGAGVPAIAAAALRVFPSPMENTLFLEPAFNGAGDLEYKLLNAAGQLVRERSVKLSSGTERQSLDVRGLAAGNYFLQVSWTGTGAAAQQSAFKLQKLN
jgi:hypothetical protein